MPVTPTSLQLDEAVRYWVSQGSGLRFDDQVIDANQMGTPSPRGIYATVLEVTETPDGTSFTRMGMGSEEGTEKSEQSLTAVFSLQWFRQGARDAARYFQFWAHSHAGIVAAAEMGLTLFRTSQVRRLDAIDEFDWEERAGLDAVLGYIAKARRQVDLIVSVDPQVHLDEVDGGNE